MLFSIPVAGCKLRWAAFKPGLCRGGLAGTRYNSHRSKIRFQHRVHGSCSDLSTQGETSSPQSLSLAVIVVVAAIVVVLVVDNHPHSISRWLEMPNLRPAQCTNGWPSHSSPTVCVSPVHLQLDLHAALLPWWYGGTSVATWLLGYEHQMPQPEICGVTVHLLGYSPTDFQCRVPSSFSDSEMRINTLYLIQSRGNI